MADVKRQAKLWKPTEEQRGQIALNLARHVHELNALEEERAAAAKDFRERLTALRKQIEDDANLLDGGVTE